MPSIWKYTSIAASIGLFIGCASGWYAGASSKASGAASSLVAGAGFRAVGSVRNVLETASSGVAAVITLGEADARITPVATFRSKDQRFCRHYEIDSAGKYEGVACRSASGAWDILYHGKVVAKSMTEGARPAGSDTAIDTIIDGGVFGAAEEQKLIKEGWKTQH